MKITYNVDTANTVSAGNGVGSQEKINRIGDSLLLAVLGELKLDGNTLLKVNNKVLRLVGGSHGVLGQLPHVDGRSSVRVLQNTGLVGAVGQVLIHTPGLGLGGGNGNTLLGGVGKEIVTAGETLIEDGVTPGGDDLDVGLKGVESKLEAYLIVALAGAAVGDGETSLALWKTQESVVIGFHAKGSATYLGNVDLGAGDHGASQRGTYSLVRSATSVRKKDVAYRAGRHFRRPRCKQWRGSTAPQ